MIGRRAASRAVLAGVLPALLGSVTACSSWRAGARSQDEVDRATIARCRLEHTALELAPDRIAALEGRYRLVMVGEREPSVQAVGSLDLAAPDSVADGGGAGPVLVGWAGIDPAPLGAVVPGDASSTDPLAPGAGAYAFQAGGSEQWHAVIRLGSEANRRDRLRFDGAHTTLRITSIAEGRFGGIWSSALNADEASGDFCAIRL